MSPFPYACAALLVAVTDALRIAPCKKKFSCRKKGSPGKNLLRVARQCWEMVPDSIRDDALLRLNVCRFADDEVYLSAYSWPQFIKHFSGGTMLSDSLQEQYSEWEEGLRTRQSPAVTIVRILQSRSPLSLPAAQYLLEPVGMEMKRKLGKMLLTELQRVCRVKFVSHDSSSQYLKIQFLPEEPPELRPLEVGISY